jgi:hypothetical protein
MRFVLCSVALMVTLLNPTEYLIAADSVAHCAQHLTFRWTSGDPIRLDVSHPAPASLVNQPFLRDPEILSVSIGQDRFGPNVTITLGPVPADVLASESAEHIGRQTLIMLEDTVIFSGIERDRISNTIMMHSFNEDKMDKLADILWRNKDSSRTRSGFCN